MTRLELEIHDDVIAAINKAQNINDSGLEVDLPIGSVLFENILNLKLLKQQIEKLGKTCTFVTEDEIGQNLVNMLEDIPQVVHEPKSRKGFKLPAISLAGIKKPALPKISMRKKGWWVLGLVLLGLYVYAGLTLPVATAKIVVNSQPLTRSLALTVDSNKNTSTESKTLHGTTLTSRIEVSAETETTGEDLVGEKAKGTVKILNKTLTEKTFKKGHIVTYDDDFDFELKGDVTVPAATDDGLSLTYGSANVEVQAKDIGEDYNIAKDKSLSVDDESESDFSAVTNDKFSGGSSKTVHVVAQADLDALGTKITEGLNEKIANALKGKVASNQKLISGSETSTVVTENYSNQLNEEADKVTLNQTLDIYGLIYTSKELENLIDALVKEFVPNGFELSEKDRETNVEVLGNTTEYTLNSTTADVQVTLKAFVVPEIDEEALKKDLAGSSPKEAAKVLSGVRNVQNYEYKVSPVLPLFRSAPKNLEHIVIEIEKQ